MDNHFDNLERLTRQYSQTINAASVPIQNLTRTLEIMSPTFEPNVFGPVAELQRKMSASMVAISPAYELAQKMLNDQRELQRAAFNFSEIFEATKIDFTPLHGAIVGVLTDHSPHIQNLAVAMSGMKPIIDVAKAQTEYLNSLPNLDFRVKTFASQLDGIIEERITLSEEFYYPPKDEIDEFINNYFHDSVTSDILTNEEQDYQDEPTNHFEQQVVPKKNDESVHKTELLSDFKDPWFHISVLIRQAHEIFMVGVIYYIAGFFDFQDFVVFFYALLKLLGFAD